MYTAALLKSAGGDNKMHPKELAWIKGHQAAFGASEKTLEAIPELQKMSLKEVCEKFQAAPKLVKSKKLLLYHCLCAAAADEDIHDEEVAAVKKLATAMSVDEKVVDEIKKLVEEE